MKNVLGIIKKRVKKGLGMKPDQMEATAEIKKMSTPGKPKVPSLRLTEEINRARKEQGMGTHVRTKAPEDEKKSGDGLFSRMTPAEVEDYKKKKAEKNRKYREYGQV